MVQNGSRFSRKYPFRNTKNENKKKLKEPKKGKYPHQRKKV